LGILALINGLKYPAFFVGIHHRFKAETDKTILEVRVDMTIKKKILKSTDGLSE
jgi:hypothetical protein